MGLSECFFFFLFFQLFVPETKEIQNERSL